MVRSRRQQGSPLSLFSFQDIITSVTGIMTLITLLLALELSQRKPIEPAADTTATTVALQSKQEDLRREIEELRQRFERQRETLGSIAGISVEKIQLERELLEQARRESQADLANDQRELARQQKELDRLQQKTPAQQAQEQELREKQKQLDQDRKKLKDLEDSQRVIFRPGSNATTKVWLVDLRATVCLIAPLNQQEAIQVLEAGSETELIGKFKSWLAAEPGRRREQMVLFARPNAKKIADALQKYFQSQGIVFGLDLLPNNVPFLPGTR